jgi:ABC-type transporter Mla maintaining outer membrane lipid asymmetry ATPase subunit MlaF
LVMDPSIVFFDEPDSGLDPVRTNLLNDLILDTHAEHKGTYRLVTHDIRTARKVSDYVGLIWKARSCTTATPRKRSRRKIRSLTAPFGPRSIFAPSRALRSCFSRRTNINTGGVHAKKKAR